MVPKAEDPVDPSDPSITLEYADDVPSGKKNFPFDVVVITSPHHNEEGPHLSLKDVLPPTTALLCTSDPFGLRMGSGGGTLAALEEAVRAVESSNSNPSILMIHSGGDSSRCPTQMCLGKAWTSLPSARRMDNPTHTLVNQMATLCRNCPQGTLAVTASDMFMSLPLDEIPPLEVDPGSVYGLGLVAPLETAKNHGVYVIESDRVEDSLGIYKLTHVMQKPSISKMQSIEGCTFHHDHQGVPKEVTWTDSGAVVFSPEAAKSLLHLTSGELKRCTKAGLEDLYEEALPTDVPFMEFAKKEAKSVDLYTHILMGLNFGAEQKLKTYEKKFGSSDLTRALYDALSKHPLLAWNVKGEFVHLGTSGELLDYVVASPHKRCESLIHGNHGTVQVHPSSVVLHSTLSAAESIIVGAHSVLEHCTLQCTELHIGENCLVSGLRGRLTNSSSCVVSGAIVIPSGICLQVLPLNNGMHVFMYLGVNDSIKDLVTLYSHPFERILEVTADLELWAPGNNRSLWNAKIHPVFTLGEEPVIDFMPFDWIPSLSGENFDKKSLAKWKSLERISLNEIRSMSDSALEYRYRQSIPRQLLDIDASILEENINILWERSERQCQLKYIIDQVKYGQMAAFQRTVERIDSIVLRGMQDSRWDVSGRCLTTLSLLFNGMAIISFPHHQPSPCGREWGVFVRNFVKAMHEDPVEAYTQLMSHHNKMVFQKDTLSFNSLKWCGEAMEKLAAAVTTHCVSVGLLQWKKTLPYCDRAVASAPARIDLAGAWSDTPPVSYEYGNGGAVTGLALKVNGRMPLSSTCLRTENRGTILLTTEARDESGVVSTETIECTSAGDLANFCDPTASCSLLMSAFVCLGVVPIDVIESDEPLNPLLQKYFGGDYGVEIVSTSYLPRGSGLGTSSILGGCVVASIARCGGIELSEEDLIKAVLHVEQLLTTGGGWQDQVGGLVGGAKVGRSIAHASPVQVTVQKIPLSPDFVKLLNERMVLVFTGYQRLAKNILSNVLRRWGRRTPDIVQTVAELVNGAEVTAKALQNGDIETVGKCMSACWEQKKVMTGESAEPDVVKRVLAELSHNGDIEGGILAGAGGGGFMFLFASSVDHAVELRRSISKGVGREDLVVFQSEFSEEGLTVTAS